MKKLLLLVLIAIMWFGFWSYRYSQQKVDPKSTSQKSITSKISSQQNQIKDAAARQMRDDNKATSKKIESDTKNKQVAKKTIQKDTKSKKSNSAKSNNSQVAKNQVSYSGAKVRGDYIDLFFEANEYADLDSDLVEYVEELVQNIKNKKCKLVVSGHTDDKGGTHTNFLEGLKRARLISKLLQKKGLKKEDILTNSYGEHAPLVKNDSPENIKKNNRVEILIAR